MSIGRRAPAPLPPRPARLQCPAYRARRRGPAPAAFHVHPRPHRTALPTPRALPSPQYRAPVRRHRNEHARPNPCALGSTRLHAGRSAGGAADSRHHVGARLRDLSTSPNLGRAYRGGPATLARNRIRHAGGGHGFRANGASAGARSARPVTAAGAARAFRQRHERRRRRRGLRQHLIEFLEHALQLGSRIPIRIRRCILRLRDPIGRAHARGLVQYRRSAARHRTACGLRTGRRCAQAQLHHRPRHRAGHETRHSGPVRSGEDRPVPVSGQQPDLAEPVAVGGVAPARSAVDPAGRGGNHGRIQGLGPGSPTDRGGRVSRRNERGVALIIALVLVALAAILATKLTFDGWLERRRASGVMAAEQAFEFGMGAEALAADVLGQSGQKPKGSAAGQSSQSTPKPQTAQNSSQVTLAQAWAQPTQPLPITPENDPEGEPIGTLQGQLEDMQGRFNLNNLGHVISVNGKIEQDPQPLEQFQRLLIAAGLEAKWAGIARDWIDADDQPGSPDGAEDAVYTAQSPPYRTGNWPMSSPSELMNLPGFGADRYRKIAPYVTALPTATAPINICTAPAFVLESLADDLSGEYSDEVLVNGRKSGCFPDKTAFQGVVPTTLLATDRY